MTNIFDNFIDWLKNNTTECTCTFNNIVKTTTLDVESYYINFKKIMHNIKSL